MYNPVVEIWKMWGEREIGKQLNAGRGEGGGRSYLLGTFVTTGNWGGGVGNKPASFRGGGRRAFDHDHQHIPHTPLAVLKRRIHSS